MVSDSQRLPPANLTEIIAPALEHAATALARMLNDKLIVTLQARQPHLEGVTVWLELRGVVPGGICLRLPETLALAMAKRLTGATSLSLLDETARSALMELANVFVSAFAADLDERYALRSLPTPPFFSLVPLKLPKISTWFGAELAVSFCQLSGQVEIGLHATAVTALLKAGAKG